METAEKFLKTAKAGVPVFFIGDLPSHPRGLLDFEKQDAALKATFAELSSLKEFHAVADEAALVGALHTLRDQ